MGNLITLIIGIALGILLHSHGTPQTSKWTPERKALVFAQDEAKFWKERYMETFENYHVTASAYALRGKTKNGAIVSKGHIAVSRDLEHLINKKVEVWTLDKEFLGTFIVTDTMAHGYKNSVDIWMPHGASKFGRKPVTLKVM